MVYCVCSWIHYMFFSVHLQLQYWFLGCCVCAASRWPGLDAFVSLLLFLSVPPFFHVGLLSVLLCGLSSCYIFGVSFTS